MPSTDEIYLLSSDIRILRDLLGGFIKKLLGIFTRFCHRFAIDKPWLRSGQHTGRRGE